MTNSIDRVLAIADSLREKRQYLERLDKLEVRTSQPGHQIEVYVSELTPEDKQDIAAALSPALNRVKQAAQGRVLSEVQTLLDELGKSALS